MVLRGDAALPQADEPEAGDAAVGEQAQLFVGDLVEAMDVALVFFRELLEPDVGALGHEDDVGHPGLVGGEGLVLVERRLVVVRVALAAAEVFVEADVLVADEALSPQVGAPWRNWSGPGGWKRIQMARSSSRRTSMASRMRLDVFAEVGRPVLADEVELAGEGVGRGERWGAQGFEERCRPRGRRAGGW